MPEALRLGVIGVHGYGVTYFDTLRNNTKAAITAVCDAREDFARPVAEKNGVRKILTDYRELLADPEIDGVLISTPHFLHCEMTMAALESGKHVFCEKPLAITARDAWAMTETAERLRLRLTCHYNRRQSPHVKLLRELVANGSFGEVYALNLKWMARYTGFMFSPDSGWRVQKDKAGGGILIGRGSHMLDAALYLLGFPEIARIGANVNNRLSGFEVDDYAAVSARLKNGGFITLECSYVANLPDYEEKLEYEVLGTKAGARCLEQDGESSFHFGHGRYPAAGWTELSGSYDVSRYRSVYPASILEDFVDAVLENRPPLITGAQAALITEILETAYASAEQNKELPFVKGSGGAAHV